MYDVYRHVYGHVCRRLDRDVYGHADFCWGWVMDTDERGHHFMGHDYVTPDYIGPTT